MGRSEMASMKLAPFTLVLCLLPILKPVAFSKHFLVETKANSDYTKETNADTDYAFSGCKTTKGQDCVFPFTFKGVTYQKCTQKGHTGAWCSTKTNWKGQHVGGHWGNCLPSCHSDTPCTTTKGERCVFPFTYAGEAYQTCTTANHERPWCSTKTDLMDRHVGGKWGECHPSCF